MEEPAQLVCWCMELIKISYEELQVLGEASVLVKCSKTFGFEHLKVSPEKKIWWDSSSEGWQEFEQTDYDFQNFITKSKEIYLIVGE
jgi:hypothetical protein